MEFKKSKVHEELRGTKLDPLTSISKLIYWKHNTYFHLIFSISIDVSCLRCKRICANQNHYLIVYLSISVWHRFRI